MNEQNIENNKINVFKHRKILDTNHEIFIT
jgi:hypothetical protein